jgi:hypothetical protein
MEQLVLRKKIRKKIANQKLPLILPPFIKNANRLFEFALLLLEKKSLCHPHISTISL